MAYEEKVATLTQDVGKHSQARGVACEQYGQKVVVEILANRSKRLACTITAFPAATHFL